MATKNGNDNDKNEFALRRQTAADVAHFRTEVRNDEHLRKNNNAAISLKLEKIGGKKTNKPNRLKNPPLKIPKASLHDQFTHQTITNTKSCRDNAALFYF